jgi:hypothetical protein
MCPGDPSWLHGDAGGVPVNSGATARRIDTLLVLGLPASGKTVILRYLSRVLSHLADTDLRVGQTIHLDDFPYVRFMWRICEVVEELGHGSVLLDPTGLKFEDLREWGTLIHLLNEDYAALRESGYPTTQPPGEWIVDRLETAHAQAGMPSPFLRLGPGIRKAVATAIDDEAARFFAEWAARSRPPGSTVVIEFARGGPEGADLPLDSPHGYAYALSLLSAEILRRATVLYVWVTPEESLHRNRQRAEPGSHGSVLHHGVPETVMRASYGTDDMSWLIDHAERPGTITVHAHESTFHLPVARFDNRRELETFRSGDPTATDSELDEQVYTTFREAFAGLVPPT